MEVPFTHLVLHLLVGQQAHEALRVAPGDERAVLLALRQELGLRHKLAVVYPLAQRLPQELDSSAYMITTQELCSEASEQATLVCDDIWSAPANWCCNPNSAYKQPYAKVVNTDHGARHFQTPAS